VDAIVQDVATRGQAEVAVRNARFLADDGRLLLAIKARSEDVTVEPETVFEGALDRLRETYEILETQRLDRFHEGPPRRRGDAEVSRAATTRGRPSPEATQTHHVGGEKPASSKIGFQRFWTESLETSIASATADCDRSWPRISAAA